jgi:hypothetical protein
LRLIVVIALKRILHRPGIISPSDGPPPAQASQYASRLIAMAVSMVGSAQEVMVCMRCSTDDFQKYCNGD